MSIILNTSDLTGLRHLSDSTGLRHLSDSTGLRHLSDSTGLRHLSDSTGLTGSRYLSDSTGIRRLEFELSDESCIFDSDCNIHYICLRGDCIKRPSDHKFSHIVSSPYIVSPLPTVTPTIAPYTINVFQEYTYLIKFSVILILLCVVTYCCTLTVDRDDDDDDDVTSTIYDV